MTTILTCARAAEDVYKDQPSAVDDYQVFNHSPAGARDFFGSSYYLGSVGIIAFRGSKYLMEDWLDADVDIARSRLPTSQLGDAYSFFGEQRNKLMKERNCQRFIVVGHSLGGALASVVASTSHRVPTSAVTFNAPGMAGVSRMGNYRDPELDRDIHDPGRVLEMAKKAGLRAPRALNLSGAPVPLGAAVGLKAYTTYTADQTQARLNLDQRNAHNILNVIVRGDVVSLKGSHIGKTRRVEITRMVARANTWKEAPVGPVEAHSIAALVKALETDPVGRENVVWIGDMCFPLFP